MARGQATSKPRQPKLWGRGQAGQGRGQVGRGWGRAGQGGVRPVGADRRDSGTDKVRARKVLAGLPVRAWSEQD